MRHEGAVALNCGRSALQYICVAKHINKIWLPYFLCESVCHLLSKCNVETCFYELDRNFIPKLDAVQNKGDWVYIVNYYGRIDNKILSQLRQQYGHIIVDNSQAYFQDPLEGVDTFYTCRKYFGVPDGAFLYTDNRSLVVADRDESFDRMHYVLGRFEHPTSEFYSEYVQRNKAFADEPMRRMSLLTDNLLRGIDYVNVRQIRENNYRYLSERLLAINRLDTNKNIPAGPFAYPFLIENGRNLRKRLIENKIYVPLLWPGSLASCAADSWEYHLAVDLLPLPIDQRYGDADMQRIADCIFDNI